MPVALNILEHELTDHDGLDSVVYLRIYLRGFDSHNTFLTSSNQIVNREGGAGSSNPKGKAPIGHNSILHNLNALLGPKTKDDIPFYGLRTYSRLGDDVPLVTSQVLKGEYVVRGEFVSFDQVSEQ
ncbi:hypothetical protein L1987_78729 [Smallanthus sonchifolius]|uniref:Uncharacterized protein n=1 Tax=Smallanthus sonchifolius TaxID=185202 RepID=A0ACB8ZCP5_9ASTR|nr:hypothetical protein L1987_78729 [Smallanthus sonchifolius]